MTIASLFLFVIACLYSIVNGQLVCPTPGDFVEHFKTITDNTGITVVERQMVNVASTSTFRLSGYYSLAAGATSGVIFSVYKSGAPTW